MAQTSTVIYGTDGLSGKLEIAAADYISTIPYTWDVIVPKDVPVKISRINNVYSYDVLYIYDGTTPLLNNSSIGEFATTITSTTGTITIKKIRQGENLHDMAIPITVKFAKISSGNSETTIIEGDIELNSGILRAYGKQDFVGSKASAILGGDYESYTLFGGVNGGRIRGSNEGYLILEGNPNGYKDHTVYVNRYVSNGNVVMTSYSGKVGIGVDSPSEKLHLGGAIRGHKTGGALEIKTQYGSLELGAQDNTGIHFKTTKPKYIFDNDIHIEGNTLRIGKVGEKGDAGDGSADVVLKYLNIDFTSYRDIPSEQDQVGSRISSYRAIKGYNGGLQKAGLIFYTNPLGNLAGDKELIEAMRITPEGKIGIGTPKPQYELDVKGTIRSTAVKIESVENFADFVFDKDYNLRSLNEVDQFIQKNGHLPEIPSATEVKENGIDLVEMQVKLLQKVEELTLYVISLQKTVDTQKDELEVLKNQAR